MIAVPAQFSTLSFPDPQWYAVETRHRFEKKAAVHLERQGVETFVPVVGEIHRWSDRQKRVDIPLFPGYAFVRLGLSPNVRLRVLRAPGVMRFVSFGTEAAPVPAKQIADAQRLLAHNIPCSLHAFLKVGRRVRIRGGCLDGLEGILEHSGEKNLVISIDCIQRSVAIKIEGYELELI